MRKETTMPRFTIARDGQRPATFEGEILAESRGSRVGGQDANRYYNLTVYQSTTASVLVHWQYVTHWQGETGQSQLSSFPHLQAAIEALEHFDPCAWVIGYKPILTRHPEQAHYQARQAELEARMRRHYAAQVSEVASALGVAEEL
jgi:hypothetical protein